MKRKTLLMLRVLYGELTYRLDENLSFSCYVLGQPFLLRKLNSKVETIRLEEFPSRSFMSTSINHRMRGKIIFLHDWKF